MLYEKEGYLFRRDGAKLWMLSKLSQTFLQNLIIHPADHRGFTKSKSPGTFENSSPALSDLAQTKQWIKSDVLTVLLLLFLLFLCLTDGVDPAVSVIKCRSGLCMLEDCLGCVDWQCLLSLRIYCGLATLKSWGEGLSLWWLFLNKMSLQKLMEYEDFGTF